jgi:tripartite-type tricarboxylate transporter receptor subunit TctC
MPIRLLLAFCAALAFGGAAHGQSSQGQSFPDKPIRLVVGYSPGGGNDLIARIVAVALQARLKQPVMVDNQPGEQANLAAEIVAKAPADGYTLLVASSGPMTINPAFYAKLSYDPIRDFAPVSLLAEFPVLLVVSAEEPIRSVKELIDYGRANPGRASYASSAAPFQLAAELFNQFTRSTFRHLPYKGSGDAVQAVVTGQALMAVVDSGAAAESLKAGKLRALAGTPSKRPPGFSKVPTFAEAGVPDMEIALWTGIVAPAGTPAAVVTRLQEAIAYVVESPETRQALEAISVNPRSTSQRTFTDIIARDTARWKQVAATVNVKLD